MNALTARLLDALRAEFGVTAVEERLLPPYPGEVHRVTVIGLPGTLWLAVAQPGSNARLPETDWRRPLAWDVARLAP